MQGVLALLDTLFVTHSAGPGAFGSAKPSALITDHGLDGREHLGGSHQSNRHARAPEDGFDDLAVIEVGNDDTVLHRVSAHHAAGRDSEVEDGVARRRKLMNELLSRRAVIEGAFVSLFENDDATALD